MTNEIVYLCVMDELQQVIDGRYFFQNNFNGK